MFAVVKARLSHETIFGSLFLFVTNLSGMWRLLPEALSWEGLRSSVEGFCGTPARGAYRHSFCYPSLIIEFVAYRVSDLLQDKLHHRSSQLDQVNECARELEESEKWGLMGR